MIIRAVGAKKNGGYFGGYMGGMCTNLRKKGVCAPNCICTFERVYELNKLIKLIKL